MQIVTVAPVFVRNLLAGASLRGYSPEQILRAQGLSAQILTNPKLRISTLAFADLCHAVTQLLRDEAFGLLAKPQPFGSFKLLAQACLSTETIKESLVAWRNGSNLLDSSVSATTSFHEDGGYLGFSCEMRAGVDSHYILETLLTTAHRLHCWLANEFLPIEGVELAYPEPEFSEEYRLVFYGAPVRFNQPRNAIHFSRSTLELACVRDKSALKALLAKPHIYLLTQPKQSKSVHMRVRLWMENLFREGHSNPQLQQVSEFLGLTPQTLRRQLQKDGYSFQQLKDDIRRDMAIFLINSKDQSVETIAFRLGFSEASTFIRAFRKWTGLTPLAYRRLS
ncbi:AraC family transcriptional regulator [Simiduia curdlanivorans]|uniref:AraC family transcriptional regulator n=1 Tax=Simiduia curdlanivorans TaxID=1492769 RepID=A0ABV8V6D5_9GAMM|nr:AraC family transcriptional regulator [Simiduia curdlanivorans]MDN3638822.1 AraC family transcriptional regulator [Simiduia curdlanivorans]